MKLKDRTHATIQSGQKLKMTKTKTEKELQAEQYVKFMKKIIKLWIKGGLKNHFLHFMLN